MTSHERTRDIRTVLVPAELMLVFDPRTGWSYTAAPAAAWWEWQERLLEQDHRRLLVDADLLDTRPLASVHSLERQRTACRPGPGPCRRRHVHASPRRALSA